MRIVWIGVVRSPRKGGMGASYAPNPRFLLELLLMVQTSQTTWDEKSKTPYCKYISVYTCDKIGENIGLFWDIPLSLIKKFVRTSFPSMERGGPWNGRGSASGPHTHMWESLKNNKFSLFWADLCPFVGPWQTVSPV